MFVKQQAKVGSSRSMILRAKYHLPKFVGSAAALFLLCAVSSDYAKADIWDCKKHAFDRCLHKGQVKFHPWTNIRVTSHYPPHGWMSPVDAVSKLCVGGQRNGQTVRGPWCKKNSGLFEHGDINPNPHFRAFGVHREKGSAVNLFVRGIKN